MARFIYLEDGSPRPAAITYAVLACLAMLVAMLAQFGVMD